MKKLLSVFLVAVLCVTSMVTVHAAGVTVTVGSQSVTQGTGNVSVDVPLSISGNTGIAGIELKVTYAEGLTLTAMTADTALSGLTFGKPGNFTANPIKVALDGETADNTNGTFIVLTFTVSSETVKEYPITLTATPGGTYDNDLNDVELNIVNGSIKVEASSVVDPTPTKPEITPITAVFNKPYTYTNDTNESVTVPSGIVFARALTQIGDYNLKEYGMLFSHNNLTVDNFVIDGSGVKKAKGTAARNTNGQFGVLFYGDAIKYGTTYYTIPYAIYEDSNGNQQTVYGENITTFTPAEN